MGVAPAVRRDFSRGVDPGDRSIVGLEAAQGCHILDGSVRPVTVNEYADALIASAAPLISLFFGFIAYVLIWDGLFGTQPPYAKAIGEWFSRAVRQPLLPRR